jgi:hypothetical protein
MLDDLNPDLPRAPREGRSQPEPRAKKEREVHPVVEREVPFGQPQDRVLANSVHAWLDGELPEAAVRTGDTARDVAFWRGFTRQMEQSRRLRTPEHVEAQIMAALPHHPPQLISPWWRREFVITPMAAVSVGAALMALAATAAVLLVAP